MEAAYTKKTAVVVLDDSEVCLIARALHELRHSSEDIKTMTGSMLLNLAGLSQEWLRMTQDINSPMPERITQMLDIAGVMSKIVHDIYGPEYDWEVY